MDPPFARQWLDLSAHPDSAIPDPTGDPASRRVTPASAYRQQFQAYALKLLPIGRGDPGPGPGRAGLYLGGNGRGYRGALRVAGMAMVGERLRGWRERRGGRPAGLAVQG